MSPNPATHPILALHYGALDPPRKANGACQGAVQSPATKQTTEFRYQHLLRRATPETLNV
jgi:hypothetical protein